MLRRFSGPASSSVSLASPAFFAGVATAAPLLSSTLRTIVVPRQLKAYGDNFAPTRREQQSYLLPHRELTEVSKMGNKAAATSNAKPVATFDDMLLPQQVRAALDELGVAVPSPIQQVAMPVVMDRETNSIILASPNGTGKTIAYLAPLFASLIKDRDVYNIPLRENRPRAVIFAPTQELIWQIHHLCQIFAKHAGFTTVAFTSTRRNNRKWRLAMKSKMPDVMVLGPSLALRAIETHRLFLDDLRHVVLDEADELVAPNSSRLGIRFLAKSIRRMLYRHLWPNNTQTLFVTSGITRDLAGYIKAKHGASVPAVVGADMHLPAPSARHRFVALQKEEHKLDALRRVLTRGGWYPRREGEEVVATEAGAEKNEASAPRESVNDEKSRGRRSNDDDDTPPASSKAAATRIISNRSSGALAVRGGEEDKSATQRRGHDEEEEARDADNRDDAPRQEPKSVVLRWEYQSTAPAPFTSPFAAARDAVGRERRCIIFFNNIDRCTAIYHKLQRYGFDVTLLHGGLPVEVRKKNFEDWATHSTSLPRILCATDVAARGLDVDVTSVINFDVPPEAAKYLNRAGRCARMGRPGSVVSLFTKREQVTVSALRQFIGKRVPLEGVHSWDVHMTKPSYSEFRTQRIQKLYKKYVSLITRRIIPAHLEKTYTKHVATWRPIWHPLTVGDHGGVPVKQQKKLHAKIMEHAIWHRRAKLASNKGGSAKFGQRGKDGSHATTPGVLGIVSVGTAEPQRYTAGTQHYSSSIAGPPDGPPK